MATTPRQILLVVSLLCVALSLRAQHTASDEPGDDVDYSVFSLEELFRVNVITASKQQEPLWDAPGVVTVLTSQEIAKFGGNNLWELLDRLPALQQNFSGGVNTISVRGGQGLVNYHLLMLIDGRPLRTSNGNISIYNAYDTFPINLIDRIEIVRGPGSVLYGTNAFEGVINIITKKSKRNKIEADLKYGSFNTKSSEVDFNYSKGDFQINSGIYFYDTDGWPYTSAVDGGGGPIFDENNQVVTFTKDVFSDNRGHRTLLQYKDFSLLAYQGVTKQFTEISFNNDLFSFHSNVSLFNLAYDHRFNKKWRVEVNVTRNEERFDYIYGQDLALATRSKDYLVEATLYGHLSDTFNFLVGSTYQQWDGYNPAALFSGGGDYPNEEHRSAYAQLTYRPNRFIKVIAGAQRNEVKGGDVETVPRFGAIWNLSPRTGIKFLHGKAFRSPIPQDRYIDTPGIQLGYPGLNSETITTTQLQFFYQGDNQLFVFTVFESEESDLVVIAPPDPNDYELFRRYYPNLTREAYLAYNLVNTNQGQLDVHGAELEAKYSPNAHWFIMTNVSYQENRDEYGTQDAALGPRFLVKTGVGYANNNQSAGLFNSHYDAFRDNRIINPNSVQINPPSEAFDILSFKYIYQFSLEKLDMSLELYGYNLLDEEVWTHELPFDDRNTIPGRAERSYYGSLRIRL